MPTKLNNWIGSPSPVSNPPVQPVPATGPQAPTAVTGPALHQATNPPPVPTQPLTWQTGMILLLAIGWALHSAGWSPWRIVTAPFRVGEAELQAIEAKHDAAISQASAAATVKALSVHTTTVEDDLEQIAAKLDALAINAAVAANLGRRVDNLESRLTAVARTVGQR